MIVIITPPRTLPDEEHIVNKLFESGLHLLHLRKPGADRDTLERYIRGIRPRFRERVVLHDHFELAEEYGLRGIHLKYNEARTFTGRDRLTHVSVSCHSFEEIDALPSSRTTSFSARYLTAFPNRDTRRPSPRNT